MRVKLSRPHPIAPAGSLNTGKLLRDRLDDTAAGTDRFRASRPVALAVVRCGLDRSGAGMTGARGRHHRHPARSQTSGPQSSYSGMSSDSRSHGSLVSAKMW